MFLEFAKGDLKKQTHSRYYRAYVNYVKDSSFGNIPARKIKKYHCDDFIRTLTNGTIVYSYVCQIKCIISQAFDYACDRELMSWNRCRKYRNSLVVYDGISHVLVVVHGGFAKKYENIH